MERIGVRELRQHASRYLERVGRGETIEVTDRGRPVALLVPYEDDPWQALVSAGRVTPAADQADVTDEAPRAYDVDASGALARARDSER